MRFWTIVGYYANWNHTDTGNCKTKVYIILHQSFETSNPARYPPSPTNSSHYFLLATVNLLTFTYRTWEVNARAGVGGGGSKTGA